MGERRLHDALETAVLRAPVGPTLEREQRGVHARRRTETGPRDGMEADTRAGQLHEHRHGAVRPCPRLRHEAIGDLPLEHHTPAGDARKPVEALHADGRRDAVRQVGDQLGRRRVEPGEVERHGISEEEPDVRDALEALP